MGAHADWLMVMSDDKGEAKGEGKARGDELQQGLLQGKSEAKVVQEMAPEASVGGGGGWHGSDARRLGEPVWRAGKQS